MSAIIDAVKTGDWAAVEKLVAEGGNINQFTELTSSGAQNSPMIALLLKAGATVEDVKRLMALGANLDFEASNKNTALYIVFCKKNWEVTNFVLQEYAKKYDETKLRQLMTNSNISGWNPIRTALYLVKTPDDLKKLLEIDFIKRAFINSKDDKAKSLLQHAFESTPRWNNDMIKILLEQGADPNILLESGAGNTKHPLTAAIELKDSELIELFLNNDKVKEIIKDKKILPGTINPCTQAALSKDWPLLKRLVDAGCDINFEEDKSEKNPNRERLNPMVALLKDPKTTIEDIQQLEKLGASIKIETNLQNTALHLAFGEGTKNVALGMYILQQYPDSEKSQMLLRPNQEGETALARALKIKTLEKDQIKVLMDAALSNKTEAEILKIFQAQDKNGNTLMRAAAKAGTEGPNKYVLLEILQKVPPEQRLSLLTSGTDSALALILQKYDLAGLKQVFDLLPEKDKLHIMPLVPASIPITYVDPNPDLGRQLSQEGIKKINDVLQMLGAKEIQKPVFYEGKEGVITELAKQFPELQSYVETEEQTEKRTEGKTLREMFKSSDVKGVLNRLKKTADAVAEDPVLLYGPLPKSSYTTDLEKIVKYIILGPPIIVDIQPRPDKDNDYFATITLADGKKEEYNLSEIIQFANLNHVKLTPEEMAKYPDYVPQYLKRMQEANQYSDAQEILEDFRPQLGDRSPLTPEKIAELQKKEMYKDLSAAEIIAINLYSGNSFRGIQRCLANQLDLVSSKSEGMTIADSLVHGVMAASGLNKIPNTELQTAFRWDAPWAGETSTGKPEKGSYVQRGFTSTSYVQPGEDMWFTPTEAIVYRGPLIGKMIQDLTVHPDLREFLIPPGTQFYFHRSKVEKSPTGTEVRFTEATTVQSPTLTPDEAMRVALDISDVARLNVTRNMTTFSEHLRDLETELRKNDYDSLYLPLVEKLNKTVDGLLADFEQSAEEKLKILKDTMDTALKSAKDLEFELQQNRHIRIKEGKIYSMKTEIEIIQGAINEFKAITLEAYSGLEKNLKANQVELIKRQNEIKELTTKLRDQETELEKLVRENRESIPPRMERQDLIKELKVQLKNLSKSEKSLDKDIQAQIQERDEVKKLLELQGIKLETKEPGATPEAAQPQRVKPIAFMQKLKAKERAKTMEAPKPKGGSPKTSI